MDSLSRAETFIDQMVESLSKTLSIFPLAGKVYNDVSFNFEMRSLAYKNYVAFYKVKNETKYILQRKESKEWKSYLELPRGNYWIYSPDIIFTQKLLQTKKVKIYYQKMNSAVCYVKK